MDALMFFEPGTASSSPATRLWENGMGFVWPQEGANPYLDAARETLETIERLDPAIVIPGHGEPFADVRAAPSHAVRSQARRLSRATRRRTRATCVKVLFVFALLERAGDGRGRGCRPISRGCRATARSRERFLGLDAAALAEWMLADLERAGAVAIRDGVVRPTLPA